MTIPSASAPRNVTLLVFGMRGASAPLIAMAKPARGRAPSASRSAPTSRDALARELRGDAERDRQRHVLRSGAAAPLLRAAEDVAVERQAAADVQRADAFRRVQLVRGERERVDAERVHVDVDLARGLHGVAVKMNRLARGRRARLRRPAG